MNRGSLKRKIAKKLENLGKILDKIEDLRVIEANDPETWDSDSLYELVDLAKEVQEILEDKEHSDPRIIPEMGLCSLVDEYNDDEENESDDE
ncbi:MAG: hypothetical protein GBAus27B_000173 [Mycoplasmataceae bacterium]|nr:MAG: hypothetical protein GBAus27B_000173 [Mycoplasmataceae bacterium]